MSCLILPKVKSQAAFNKELPKEFTDGFTKEINDSISSLGSFIVSQNNKVIYEQYFHGANKETIFSIKSVTKVSFLCWQVSHRIKHTSQPQYSGFKNSSGIQYIEKQFQKHFQY